MANRFPLIVDSSNQNIKELPDGDNLILGDGEKLILGDGSDLNIFHDGNNSFINNTSGAAGTLSIKSHDINIMSSGSETMAAFVEDGAASLYYDNSPKLATTSTGATVTGTIGWEGLRHLKPVITFGNAYYNYLPDVYFWHKNINIKKILKTKINKNYLNNKIYSLSKKMGFGLDSEDYSSAADLTSSFQKKKYNESHEIKTLINSLETILKNM